MPDEIPESSEETAEETDETVEESSRKKSRVLHTRVPAILERELKNLAQSWKVPVSNVVRAILEDAIETMDVASHAAQDELRSVADRLRPRRAASRPATRPPLAGAIGVSELTLVRDSTCGLTGEALASGAKGVLVHFDDGRAPLLVAPEALPSSLQPSG
ncbi:MAG: hypothetical protein AAGE52_22740 [Myxococcota bacterium]